MQPFPKRGVSVAMTGDADVVRKLVNFFALTGLAVAAGKLYILNFGSARAQRIAADFDETTPIEDVAVFERLPTAPPPGE